MTTPTIDPQTGAGNDPSGPFTPVPHTHPFTAITGLRFGSNGRVEPVYDPHNVFANGVLIALYNAATTPGSTVTVAVPDVNVVFAVKNNDGDDTSVARAQVDRFLAEGKITPQQYATLTQPTPEPRGAGVAPPAEQPAGLPVDPVLGTIDFSTVLTPNGTTLGDMIKKVTFPRTIAQLSNNVQNLPPQNIVNNLAALALNIVEPVKAKYPNAFLTNSYRQGEGQSQHGTGQACDMQFKGVRAHDYFDIAVWMSKNLPYGQLLLEYLPNQTVWIHISYEIPSLPYGGIVVRQVNKLATLNGAAGGRFVPNLHRDIIVSSIPNKIVAS
jgi:hypothetical protein